MAYFLPHTGRISRFGALGLVAALLTSVPVAPPYAAPPPPTHPAPAPADVRIAAVVNGDVITNVDVEDRAKLFALSTGQPLAPDVLARLRPQILRQLIDERLRIQEAQRRKVVIQDKQIAEAIRSIEERNNLPPGTLRQKLAADGISLRTLVDQIRTQLAWIQVIREQLGPQAQVTQTQIAERQHVLEQATGKPEYHVAEIIIPIEDPANAADAQRFAETVITQLRAGAPFTVVAAQFSQSQNALEGGDLGWVEPSRLDPAVARVVEEMPPGAVSNPIRVPGGIAIVTLIAKRDLGNDMATMLSVRQVFFPFSAPLNPQAPTEQQRQMLQKARSISTSVHSCDQMEEVAKANQSPHPVNPGDVRLETVSPPPFKQLLSTIPIGQVTQPLVSSDGITVMMVCSREQKNLATGDPQALRAQIVEERAELAARQLEQSLRRQATIDIRPTA
jgi:peptidyl-prolyl cis-trans isomerase SurA